MAEKQSKPPTLFEYLDIFKFLQDYYHFRKRQNGGFSYETWAEELGFKSRSYLRMILMGRKRASDQFCSSFAEANQLRQKEAAYLHALAKYSQAGMQNEKRLYGQQLIQILKTVSDRKIVSDSIEFLSKPLYARLLVMLGFEDIHPTSQTFARFLGTSEAEMREALEKLRHLHLAHSSEIDGEVHWRTSHIKFDVPDQFTNVPLMRFHELSLADSVNAFHQPKDLRRYKSLLLPLSEAELIEFHSLVEDFAAQQLARFQANSYKGRRLFQVNLNVFSVAEPIAETPAEQPRTG